MVYVVIVKKDNQNAFLFMLPYKIMQCHYSFIIVYHWTHFYLTTITRCNSILTRYFNFQSISLNWGYLLSRWHIYMMIITFLQLCNILFKIALGVVYSNLDYIKVLYVSIVSNQLAYRT